MIRSLKSGYEILQILYDVEINYKILFKLYGLSSEFYLNI